MTRILNHVDHIVWLSAPDTFDQHRQQLAVLAGVPLDGPYALDDIGCDVVVNVSAGIAIVAPTDGTAATDGIGALLRRRLAERGEGLLAVCLGVPDLACAIEAATARGLQPGKPQQWLLGRPWENEIESASVAVLGSLLDTVLYLGEIHYKPGVLSLRADRAGYAQNVNHIDHVAWLTDGNSFADAVAEFTTVVGSPLDGPYVNEAAGMQIALSWNSGIELLAPVPGAEGAWLVDMLNVDLAEHGPGHHSVIFGVPDIEAARARATEAGYQISPMINQESRAPWADKTDVFHETVVGQFMGSQFVLGQITYRDDVFVTED